MKKNSTKSLKWLTGVTIVSGIFYILMLGCQTAGYFFGYPVAQRAVCERRTHPHQRAGHKGCPGILAREMGCRV